MYVRNDEILAAAQSGRLTDLFDGTRLRAYQSFGGSCSVYGFTSSVITRCGRARALPDGLREVMENLMNAMIQHKGPPTSFGVVVDSARRVYDCGAIIPNWVYVKIRGGAKPVADAIELGIVTDIEWKRPALRMLGLDTESGQVFYEYLGEDRTA